MERDYICILNICLVCMLWYSKENPACVLWIDSTFWNTCSILMHIVIIKGIEKKKKEKIYSVYSSSEHVQHYEMF